MSRRFKNVAKSYGAKQVFCGANFIIERGDRDRAGWRERRGQITLIKLLSGTEPLTSGEYVLGHNVDVDYFAQDQYKELNPNARMLDDLTEAAPRTTTTELRTCSGVFCSAKMMCSSASAYFRAENATAMRSRGCCCHPSNFLLLDEPTNHLDIRAKDVLLEAMEEFTGTVVFVSHDRYFIENLATACLEIEDGEVRVFPGNYADYLWRKQGGAENAPTLKDVLIGVPPADPIPMPTRPASTKRMNPIKLKQMQDQAKELEEQIAELETQIQQSELQLSIS